MLFLREAPQGHVHRHAIAQLHGGGWHAASPQVPLFQTRMASMLAQILYLTLHDQASIMSRW